jgi:hypothetical protein
MPTFLLTHHHTAVDCPQDIDRFLEPMNKPEFSCNFYPLVSPRGRRAPR